jgi:4-amino-4-deoxy-L-arabinose transferase-like glycosyltransferase
MDAGDRDNPTRSETPGGGWTLVLLLAATLLIRLIHIDQPIVENYVGRQIPTAMVARNLDRGSGLLRPQLDTAPFPNYFLVEPPFYELGVVVLRRITGSSLEVSGRTLSALATMAAAWGIFELMSRRRCRRAALFAVGAFAFFPITLRYGRAFQPDLAMMGATVAGLACWDRYEAGGRRYWLVAGWSLLALGFAIKIIAAFLLVPLVLAVHRARRMTGLFLACATLMPALSWYAWADHLVAGGSGSRASADNRAIWLGLLGLSALSSRATWELILRFLFIRAFTPMGMILALLGLFYPGAVRLALRPGWRGGAGPNEAGSEAFRYRLWWIWALAASTTLAILAQKLHHEYYFLLLAPPAAAGIGHALDRLAAVHRVGALATFGVLIVLGMVQARSTWRMPDDWEGLVAASRAVAVETPPDAWIVAPEAMLYQADRRGCRLEWTPSSVRRAAGEWGAEADVRDPLELVECYRRRGARYFADLGDRRADPRRMALHDAVRRRYKVIVDRPEVIIADLVVVEMHTHAH